MTYRTVTRHQNLPDERVTNSGFVRIPIIDIVQPVHGHILIADHWWIITDDDHVMFHYGISTKGPHWIHSPLCNSNQHIAEVIAQSMNERVIQLPFAYIPTVNTATHLQQMEVSLFNI